MGQVSERELYTCLQARRFRSVKMQTGRDFLETVIRYLLSAAPNDRVSRDDIQEAVTHTIPHIGGEIMMTIADTLIEEGYEKGMKTGIERGVERGTLQTAREDILDVLEIRFSTVTESLVSTMKRVQEASILKILHRKAIQAESFEAFERFLYDMLR